MASLKVQYRGQESEVTGGSVAVIGAGQGAEILVPSPGVSRRHALVRFEGDHWVLVDTASLNGTYFGGERIQRLEIRGPVEVRLGHPDEGELLGLEPVGVRPADRASEPHAVAAKPAAGAAATTGELLSISSAGTGESGRWEEIFGELIDAQRRLIQVTWALTGAVIVVALVVVVAVIVS